MTSKLMFISSAMLTALSVLAQNEPTQSLQTYSPPSSSTANPVEARGTTFSNRAGQNFTPQDLATQLQNLRAIVDQTLPVLSAFNEQSSNSMATGSQSVGGALSGIVSDVLHRNRGTGQQNVAGQGSLHASNLLAILHGLLSTNSPSGASTGPANPQDLIALENDLRPVASLLDRLNVSGNSNFVNSSYPRSTTYPGANPTPTGR